MAQVRDRDSPPPSSSPRRARPQFAGSPTLLFLMRFLRAAVVSLLAACGVSAQTVSPILSFPVTIGDRIDHLNVFSDQSAEAAATAFCVRNSLSFKDVGAQLVSAVNDRWVSREQDPVIFTFMVTIDGKEFPVCLLAQFVFVSSAARIIFENIGND